MRRTFGVLIAAALVAPVAASAQDQGMKHPMPGPGMHMEQLLKQRELLGLTAEQVTQLEQIHQQVEAKNRPLMDKLHAMRGDSMHGEHARAKMTDEQRAERREKMKAERQKRSEMTEEEREKRREEMEERREARHEAMEEKREEHRERMEEARPLLEQMRANHREAMEAVKDVLTDEQEAKLRAFHESHQRKPRQERDEREKRRPAGRTGV